MQRMASSSSHSRTNSVRPRKKNVVKRKEDAAIDLALTTEADFLDCLKKNDLHYAVKSPEYRRVYARYYRKVKAAERYVMSVRMMSNDEADEMKKKSSNVIQTPCKCLWAQW